MVKEKKKKSKIVLILILCIILSGSYFGLKYYFNYSKVEISKLDTISLKPDVMLFTKTLLPEVYENLTKFDKEIKLINIEIIRLKKIESNFPEQKKIVAIESKKWITLKKNMQKSLSGAEKKIKSVYVSFSVNEITGTDLITEEKEGLKQTLENSLVESDKETTRLKNRKKKSFFEKIKDLLF